MGLFDFSRPKWKRSKAHIRREGVKELKDRYILEDMAVNDEDASVRDAAVEKLGEVQHEIERIRGGLNVGMSLGRVTGLLGQPSSAMGGGDALNMARNMGAGISGSASAIAQMVGKQFMEWERPEGRYRLVIVGNELNRIYSAPEDVKTL